MYASIILQMQAQVTFIVQGISFALLYISKFSSKGFQRHCSQGILLDTKSEVPDYIRRIKQRDMSFCVMFYGPGNQVSQIFRATLVVLACAKSMLAFRSEHSGVFVSIVRQSDAQIRTL